MSIANKEILERGNAAIVKGDNEGFLALCTDDTQWTFVGGKVLKGKDAVRQWMKETYLEPPDFKVAHLIAEGDFLTALGDITMKDKEGKPIRYQYCDVWRFRGNKLAALKAFVIEHADLDEEQH